jgi:hypothetical protein
MYLSNFRNLCGMQKSSNIRIAHKIDRYVLKVFSNLKIIHYEILIIDPVIINILSLKISKPIKIVLIV